MAHASETTAGSTGAANSHTCGPLFTMRAALVADTTYEPSSHIDLKGSPTLAVYVALASVDYTSIQTLAEFSHDATTWYEDLDGATSVTLSALQSATDGLYCYDIACPAYRYARIKIKRTAGSATGTVAIYGAAGTES